MSFNIILYLSSFVSILQNSVYLVLTLYKYQCSFVLPFQCVAFIDVVILVISLFMENCLKYEATHDFSVRLKTSSNSSDINRFRSHTENINYYFLYFFSIIETPLTFRSTYYIIVNSGLFT